jgi:hypothetical protein
LGRLARAETRKAPSRTSTWASDSPPTRTGTSIHSRCFPLVRRTPIRLRRANLSLRRLRLHQPLRLRKSFRSRHRPHRDRGRLGYGLGARRLVPNRARRGVRRDAVLSRFHGHRFLAVPFLRKRRTIGGARPLMRVLPRAAAASDDSSWERRPLDRVPSFTRRSVRLGRCLRPARATGSSRGFSARPSPLSWPL